jgi:hypothetical protein
MYNLPIVARFWGYGWLGHDSVRFWGAAADANLLDDYISSPAFHTTFQPSDGVVSGIHGPFSASQITPADFIPLQAQELEEYVGAISLLGRTLRDDHTGLAAILPHLRREFDAGLRCHVLMRNEKDIGLFFGPGVTLDIFRELLFVDSSESGFERYVIGHD